MLILCAKLTIEYLQFFVASILQAVFRHNKIQGGKCEVLHKILKKWNCVKFIYLPTCTLLIQAIFYVGLTSVNLFIFCNRVKLSLGNRNCMPREFHTQSLVTYQIFTAMEISSNETFLQTPSKLTGSWNV